MEPRHYNSSHKSGNRSHIASLLENFHGVRGSVAKQDKENLYKRKKDFLMLNRLQPLEKSIDVAASRKKNRKNETVSTEKIDTGSELVSSNDTLMEEDSSLADCHASHCQSLESSSASVMSLLHDFFAD